MSLYPDDFSSRAYLACCGEPVEDPIADAEHDMCGEVREIEALLRQALARAVKAQDHALGCGWHYEAQRLTWGIQDALAAVADVMPEGVAMQAAE